jgi:hypothetical protein
MESLGEKEEGTGRRSNMDVERRVMYGVNSLKDRRRRRGGRLNYRRGKKTKTSKNVERERERERRIKERKEAERIEREAKDREELR